jgi:hypothetical protein
MIMKKIFTMLVALTVVTLVTAQVTESKKGFVLEFNVEDGSAPELFTDGTFDGVSFDWEINDDSSYTATWTIENGALKWVQSEDFARFAINFDPPLDLSEDASLAYKYYYGPAGGEFIMGWGDADDLFGGEYFPFADGFAIPETEEWIEDDQFVFDPSSGGQGASLAKFGYFDIVLEGITAATTFYLDDIVIGDGELSVSSRDMESGRMLSVYPNPSYGQVAVQFASDVSLATIAVYNSTGQKVFDLRNAGTYTEVDLSSFAKGVYFIRADADGTSSTSKIILR